MGPIRALRVRRFRAKSPGPPLEAGGFARNRPPGPRLTPLRTAVVACTVLTLLGGCGFRGVASLPLPGGADLGDDPYEVTVHFEDVLDLVPNSGVRVNDVPVGRVTDIGLVEGTWLAKVTLKINGNVELPENAFARVRQSSLLGEKFVSLSPPPEPVKPTGQLGEGDVIEVGRTGRGTEVEEVLGALSLLLNGGGVAQLQKITRELNAALEGREPQLRSLLSNLDELVASLDAQRDDITRALDGLNRLTATLNAQRGDIDVALRELGPGLKVLNEQRDQLVTMLESLDELSSVATGVVNRSKEDLVHDLNALAPVLRQLAEAGNNLPKALEVLFTFPFPDAAAQGIKGDYTNLYVEVDLNLTHILTNLGRSRQPLVKLPDPPPLPLPLPGPSPAPVPVPEQPRVPAGPPVPGGPDDGRKQDRGGLLDSLFGGR